jgi:basic amino acid/polyamine antiporter, APA family
VIILSFSLYETKYLTPFEIKKEGFSGFVQASTVLYYTYIGFDYTTLLCDEAINPRRDVPKGIKISLSLIIAIYTIFALGISGVGDLSTTKEGGKTAVVDVFAERGYTWAAIVIIIMACIGIFAVVLLGVIGLSRYTYNLAKDGLFFEVFKKLDPKRKIPAKGAWINLLP